MIKLPAAILFFVFSAFAQEPDTVTIFHKYYSTTFSRSRHFPVVVKYWLTREMLSCDARIKRTNRFRADPQLRHDTDLGRDYARSGYDRGHNMPAEDNRCDDQGMRECFYYSNMTPQTHSLNAGAWKTLEERERAEAIQYDSVLVWCGSVSSDSVKIGRVFVPEYCWKVLFVKATADTEAYSFRNDSLASRPLEGYRITVDSVRVLTGRQSLP